MAGASVTFEPERDAIEQVDLVLLDDVSKDGENFFLPLFAGAGCTVLRNSVNSHSALAAQAETAQIKERHKSNTTVLAIKFPKKPKLLDKILNSQLLNPFLLQTSPARTSQSATQWCG